MNYADKIDLRTGLPLKNSMNWNCIREKLFTIHGGIMKIKNIKVNTESLITLNVQHLLDCQVEYDVKAKLDIEKGTMMFKIPIEIGECSRQCRLQR